MEDPADFETAAGSELESMIRETSGKPLVLYGDAEQPS